MDAHRNVFVKNNFLSLSKEMFTVKTFLKPLIIIDGENGGYLLRF